MHYCSSAYINHYEIFLGEKCSRACREPLCPLFKWNKLVILRAWQIICNKSLGDFLLLVNGDCIFQSHRAPKELKSGSCARAEAALGEPPKLALVSLHQCSTDSGGLMALGHKVTFLHGTASCSIHPSTHPRLTQESLTLLYPPISSSGANTGIPDTAFLHKTMDLEWDRVSSDLFLSVFLRGRETEWSINS